MMEAINEAESRLRADRAATTRVPSIRSFLFFFFLFFNLAVGSRTKEDIQGNISSFFFLFLCLDYWRSNPLDGVKCGRVVAKVVVWSPSTALNDLSQRPKHESIDRLLSDLAPARPPFARDSFRGERMSTDPPLFLLPFSGTPIQKRTKKKIAQQRVGMMRHRSG